MDKNSKIGLVEIVGFGILVLMTDLIEILATFGVVIPVIGPALPFMAGIYGFIISAFVIFWLIMKGVSIKWFLGGSGLEFIPLINALPFRTAAFIATIIEDHLPEEAKKLTSQLSKVKGGK